MIISVEQVLFEGWRKHLIWWISLPYEVISLEQPYQVIPIFDEAANSIHPITSPFSLINASISPWIYSNAFPFVKLELPSESVSWLPTICAFSMFMALLKFSFIKLPIVEPEFSLALLDIIFPITIILVSIFIDISSIESLIIFKRTPKIVPIKQN